MTEPIIKKQRKDCMRPAAIVLLISCEHAVNTVPPELAPLFRGAETVLASHRGWDPGALTMARSWAEHWHAPLFAAEASRLVCDCNRSLGHPALWSEFTRALPSAEKNALLARWHHPHRDAVTAEVRRHIAAGHIVLHLAAHSFTPVLNDAVRVMDIGLLYDPGRPLERALAPLWQRDLTQIASSLRVRRNAPYRGVSDGLPTALRRLFPADRYGGFEIECNQALLDQGPFPAGALAQSLERVLRKF